MMARNNLAMVLLKLERSQEALDEAEQAVDTAMGLFERSIPIAPLLDTCGQAYLALLRTREARERFTASLRQAVDNAADHFAVSPLIGLARAAAMDRAYSDCLIFVAAARRAAMASGTRLIKGSDQVSAIESAERASRAELGGSAAKVAWERGSSMDARAALEFMSNGDAPQPLSPREQQVANLVALGLSDKEIAQRLAISSRTVEVHLARVRQKLGFRNRAEVAVWAASEVLAD